MIILVFLLFFLITNLIFLSIADIYRFIILVPPLVTRPSRTNAYLRQPDKRFSTTKPKVLFYSRFIESQKGERRKRNKYGLVTNLVWITYT